MRDGSQQLALDPLLQRAEKAVDPHPAGDEENDFG